MALYTEIPFNIAMNEENNTCMFQKLGGQAHEMGSCIRFQRGTVLSLTRAQLRTRNAIP